MIIEFRSDAGLECLVAICGSDGSFHRGSDVLRRYPNCIFIVREEVMCYEGIELFIVREDAFLPYWFK